MQKALSIGCCACLPLLLVLCGLAQAQTSLSIHHRVTAADEERINEVLARRGSLEVVEVPIRVVAQSLGEQFQVSIVISPKKLEEAAVSLDTPVTARLDNLPLESILNLVLHEIGLEFTVRDNVLLITTPDDCNSPQSLETRVYPARDLITPSEYSDSLIEMVTTVVAPQSWDEVGGPASVSYLEATGTLVVSQTWHNHRHLERLLETLRRAGGGEGPSATSRGSVRRAAPRSAAPAPRRYVGDASERWQLPQLHAED